MHSTRLTHYLYTASLFLLILLTAIAIAISAADVIIQALADRTESDQLDYRNLVVVAASYVVLVRISVTLYKGAAFQLINVLCISRQLLPCHFLVVEY